MKKALVIMLAVVFIGLAVFVPGQVQAEEEITKEGRTVIEFWTFWGSDHRRPLIEHLADEFNRSQNQYYAEHLFVPWGEIWTKNQASIAAGNPTDVIVNDINTVPQRARAEQNINFSPFIDEEFSEQYFDELWNTVLYEGDPYALPFVTDTRFLFYNKDHFEEVGLDPEDPPTTWDELWEYADKLDIEEGGRYQRFGFYPTFGNFGESIWLRNADAGVGWFDYSLEGPDMALINTPAKVEALEWLVEWREKYGEHEISRFQAEFGAGIQNPFISERVSMICNTATFLVEFENYAPDDMNLGIAPVPEARHGSGHWSEGGGFVFEIPKGAENPEASFELIKFLTSDPEAQAYWASQNFENVAHIEGSSQAAESDNLTELGREVYSFSVDNLAYTRLTPQPLNAPDYGSIIGEEIDAALYGEKTPAEALENAQKAIEDLILTNIEREGK